MSFVNSFISKIVPANYFITKSMELSRLGSSGTLWYTKKFLVYYYYIFLYKNIETQQIAREIRLIFDNYINSMPIKMQGAAKSFFYSDTPTADLRSDKFRLFSDFAGHISFSNDSSINDYYEMAKKYYMAFLMESGGQSGVKEHIKRHLYDETFCFSNIDRIILQFNNSYTSRELTGIKNDYMAFIRNERQILFYFGLVHSKSTGAIDREFSSLTPVGHLALHASYWELIAIWEHQKVKMVSQPVTIDINQIEGLKVNVDNFSINRDPYLTILDWLDHRGDLTKMEYTYILSRTKGVLTNKEMDELSSDIYRIGSAIEHFQRRGDKLTSADFLKELKKYTLGIVKLENDFDSNVFACCEYNSNRSDYSVTSPSKLRSLVSLYRHLSNYKNLKYCEIFNKCEWEIRRQYAEKIAGNEYVVNPSIKIDWDLYNIHVDKYIFLGVMIAIAEPFVQSAFNHSSIARYSEVIREMFSGSLRVLGLSSSALRKELSILYKAISTNDYSLLIPIEVGVDSDYRQSRYNRDVSEGTLAKIIDESNKAPTYEDGERKRNFTLIALIRRYNAVANLTDGNLLCECCHQPTFRTDDDESYVEYHHLIPFSICDGPDDYKNIFALCPSCHRKMHYLKLSEKSDLYYNLSEHNYLHETIEDRLISLFREGKVRSYQLEYLLADNAINNEQYNHILNS